MFAVIYTFHVKKGEEKAFVKSWSALTKLIVKRKGSSGSRLHFTAPGIYMAYALWSDKETWDSRKKRYESFIKHRRPMLQTRPGSSSTFIVLPPSTKRAAQPLTTLRKQSLSTLYTHLNTRS